MMEAYNFNGNLQIPYFVKQSSNTKSRQDGRSSDNLPVGKL